MNKSVGKIDDDLSKLTDKLSALDRLLGTDNVEDVKKRIANLIVSRVASDIHDYDYYMFYPGDYKATIEEAFESVEKKLIKMYKDAALESAQEAVQRFKDIASSTVTDTPGLQLRSCHKCKNQYGNKCMFYEGKPYYWIAHDTICAEEGFINYVEKDGK